MFRAGLIGLNTDANPLIRIKLFILIDPDSKFLKTD